MTTTANQEKANQDKRFTLLTVDDDATECSVCGKTGLKRVMWIKDIETDDIFQVGTTCGSRMLGTTASKFNTRVNNYAAKVTRQIERYYQIRFPFNEQQELLKPIRGIFGKQRRATPEYQEFMARKTEAHEWARQQPINVEL